MNRFLCIAALVLSSASLALSVWTHSQAEARVERALEKRERALVEKWKPHFVKVFHEFDTPNRYHDPQTIDDLFQPLMDLIAKLGSSG